MAMMATGLLCTTLPWQLCVSIDDKVILTTHKWLLLLLPRRYMFLTLLCLCSTKNQRSTKHDHTLYSANNKLQYTVDIGLVADTKLLRMLFEDSIHPFHVSDGKGLQQLEMLVPIFPIHQVKAATSINF